MPILASSAQAQPGDALRFASAVAGYADLLRGGTRFDGWGWDQVIATARAASGEDADGLRHEFVELAGQARTLVAPGQGEGMAVAPMPAVVR